MQKRKINKLNVEVSLLGMGCMRLPMKDGQIDDAEAERIIDHAIASGVNYIDTAYPYHNGESEPFVGKVLKKYDRKSLYLATKMPLWQINSLEEARTIFNQQLERLQTEYVDFYLLHALDKARWDKVVELGILDYLEEERRAGKIKFIGFSFHDEKEVFMEIINHHNWDFCQIQLNYMDTDHQQGIEGYEEAKKLDIPVVIMEPIKGGTLAVLPEDINAIFKEVHPEWSTASWALRFVANHDNIKVVLSGMSTYDQLEDNINTMSSFAPLTEIELSAINKVTAEIKSHTKIGCTWCEYCLPCPFGLDIPRNFDIWNQYSMYGGINKAKDRYNHMKPEERADMCQQCGACEAVCPQALNIIESLQKVAKEEFAK